MKGHHLHQPKTYEEMEREQRVASVELILAFAVAVLVFAIVIIIVPKKLNANPTLDRLTEYREFQRVCEADFSPEMCERFWYYENYVKEVNE